ncbi:MAG: tRNA dihydrouridine synthase DusB [Pseudomonadota bacterium]
MNIGPYILDNPLILAPMAGVTDAPFRELCKKLGAAMTVSEMVSSNPAVWQTKKSQSRLIHSENSGLRVVQIAGSEPKMLADAAKHNVAHGAQIIDINMGCPAKKVCQKAAGSALLKDEALVKAILESVVDAVDVPVTLKIRTGWDPSMRNGPRIAQIAETAGIQALAVHGRTRACRFNGEAEYKTIKLIKKCVAIPVIANGDINSPEKAKQVLEETGVDGIMIGRKAQGRPWIFREILEFMEKGASLDEPDTGFVMEIMLQHIQQLHHFYGEFMGVRIARKHVGWYLKDVDAESSFRRVFNHIEVPTEQLKAVEQFFATNRDE